MNKKNTTMETIEGMFISKFFYNRNQEGLYDVLFIDGIYKKKYRTDFIYTSVNRLNRFQICVSKTDKDGNKKYGLIVDCSRTIYFIPCLFDKIKPLGSEESKGFIGDKEYLIKYANVYDINWELKLKKQEDTENPKKSRYINI